MPSACIAAGYKNRTRKAYNLKLKNLPVNTYVKVCSAHFNPNSYLRDLRMS